MRCSVIKETLSSFTMGLFDIFRRPVHEKYGELIHALKEHYQPLHITKVETSVFSMSASHCNNIDNLTITIYKGSAFNERPTEYSHLYYEDYVFVKTTYSINGEAIAIRNAFPKNGNQSLMFTSIIGAEMIKTNYEIELQHQKEIEKKKAEEERIRKEQEKLENLKTIRQEIESSCQETLSDNQKVVLISYLSYFTEDICKNKLKYCMLFNLDVSKIEFLSITKRNTPSFIKSLFEGMDSYNTSKYYLQQELLLSIRNRNAIYTFIHYCSKCVQKRSLFIEILKEWGFQDFEIKEFIENPPTLPEIEAIEDIFNVPNISSKQKIALSSIIKVLAFLAHPTSLSTKVVDIVFCYENVLGLSSEQIGVLNAKLSIEEKDKYIQSIKTIWDISYINVFLFVGLNIIKLMDYNDSIIEFFKETIKKLSLSQNEIQSILSKKFNYEWEKYKEDLKIIGIQTTSIIQTWSLLDFAREYGKPKLAHCKNQDTGEEFTCVVFGEPSNRIFVAFSFKLGELTPQEIVDKKEQLKVAKWVKGNEDGYVLYE